MALHHVHSDALLHADRVYLTAPDGTRVVRSVARARRSGRGLLLALEGVVDRDLARQLAGFTVSVDRSRLPPLGDGEFYLADLVGARVDGPAGHVGTVVEIRCHPSVDSVVVEGPDGARREQPLCEPWIRAVDAEAGRIELSSVEGLV